MKACGILLSALAALGAGACGGNAPAQPSEVSVAKFRDAVNHWRAGEHPAHARYETTQVREIADNLAAWQNGDGGWPKNIDWLAVLDADSVRATLPPHKLKSTLDNSNVYSQVEYLAQAYERYGDERHAASARRGIEYILDHQHPNGGWRGSDADAITFNDGVMTGVLFTWLDVMNGRSCYDWIEAPLRERIAESWRRGVELILKCQYVQHGVRTVWGQQHDHATLLPVKARSYELPGLASSESAGVAMLLMAIADPAPEIVEAVECAVAWFERTKIKGIRIEQAEVPEAEREEPAAVRDRRVVADPGAGPLWARYYELEDNRPFFCRRDGTKVYSLAEVNAERRGGYGWYGDWGRYVLDRYDAWKREREQISKR